MVMLVKVANTFMNMNIFPQTRLRFFLQRFFIHCTDTVAFTNGDDRATALCGFYCLAAGSGDVVTL